MSGEWEWWHLCRFSILVYISNMGSGANGNLWARNGNIFLHNMRMMRIDAHWCASADTSAWPALRRWRIQESTQECVLNQGVETYFWDVCSIVLWGWKLGLDGLETVWGVWNQARSFGNSILNILLFWKISIRRLVPKLYFSRVSIRSHQKTPHEGGGRGGHFPIVKKCRCDCLMCAALLDCCCDCLIFVARFNCSLFFCIVVLELQTRPYLRNFKFDCWRH